MGLMLRRRMLLALQATGVLLTMSGTPPLALLYALAGVIESLIQTGKCEQASTPTLSSPVDIKCNNGAIKLGSVTYPSALGQTAYSGTLNLTTGILTVTHKTLQSSTWRLPTTTDTKNRWAIGMSIPDALTELRGKMWAATTNYYSACDRLEKKPEANAQEGEATFAIYGHANSVEWRVRIPNTYTAEEAQAIANASTLCYPCEPFTVQLSPQTVAMLAETTQFQSNANGNIDITYYANGILKTVSGNPIVITDADGQNAQSVVIHFEPVQSGSGTPSPNNIRPISGYSAINVTRLGGLVVDGTTEVLSITASGVETQTASVENLLGVGDYKDTQEVIGGRATRKCGIKVLDGTESFQYVARAYACIYDTGVFPGIRIKSQVLCTHLVYSASTPSGTDRTGTIFYGQQSGVEKLWLGFDVTTFDTEQKVRDWLAAQFANGTPVIMVYPLAEETTESVSAQPLQLQAGTNVVDITQASLSGIELSVTYRASQSP